MSELPKKCGYPDCGKDAVFDVSVVGIKTAAGQAETYRLSGIVVCEDHRQRAEEYNAVEFGNSVTAPLSE